MREPFCVGMKIVSKKNRPVPFGVSRFVVYSVGAVVGSVATVAVVVSAVVSAAVSVEAVVAPTASVALAESSIMPL